MIWEELTKIAIVVGIVGWATLALLYFMPKLGKECVTGAFIVQSQIGMAYVGDQEMCGYDLEIGSINGPGKLKGVLN